MRKVLSAPIFRLVILKWGCVNPSKPQSMPVYRIESLLTTLQIDQKTTIRTADTGR